MNYYVISVLLLSFAHLSFAGEMPLIPNTNLNSQNQMPNANMHNQTNLISNNSYEHTPTQKAVGSVLVAFASSLDIGNKLNIVSHCISPLCKITSSTELIFDGIVLICSLYYFSKNLKIICKPESNNNSEIMDV
jgi:hypothetical protein